MSEPEKLRAFHCLADDIERMREDNSRLLRLLEKSLACIHYRARDVRLMNEIKEELDSED